MITENYYIAQYQTILDRNATKVAILDSLNDKEQENYPNEYPDLNYDDIFKDEDPDDFLEAILKSTEYEDFYALVIKKTRSF
jgi:hypothetical protein